MLVSFLFSVVNVFDIASYVSSFWIQSLLIPSYLGTIPSILYPHPFKKERPDTSLFLTANTNSSSNDPPSVPWIDAARPPHGTAMHIVVAR